MNYVDAQCKRCNQFFRWLRGTPMICNRCIIRLNAKTSNIKAKVKSK